MSDDRMPRERLRALALAMTKRAYDARVANDWDRPDGAPREVLALLERVAELETQFVRILAHLDEHETIHIDVVHDIIDGKEGRRPMDDKQSDEQLTATECGACIAALVALKTTRPDEEANKARIIEKLTRMAHVLPAWRMTWK